MIEMIVGFFGWLFTDAIPEASKGDKSAGVVVAVVMALLAILCIVCSIRS